MKIWSLREALEWRREFSPSWSWQNVFKELQDLGWKGKIKACGKEEISEFVSYLGDELKSTGPDAQGYTEIPAARWMLLDLDVGDDGCPTGDLENSTCKVLEFSDVHFPAAALMNAWLLLARRAALSENQSEPAPPAPESAEASEPQTASSSEPGAVAAEASPAKPAPKRRGRYPHKTEATTKKLLKAIREEGRTLESLEHYDEALAAEFGTKRGTLRSARAKVKEILSDNVGNRIIDN